MRRTPVFYVALALLVGPPALAQRQPPPAPPADMAFAGQKAAFLALPLENRKAAQDALVWLGFYNGVSDGEFGKRTRDALAAWQQSQKLSADGVLSPDAFGALVAAANKARASAGFATIDDKKTGARIGAPAKLIGARGGAKLDVLAGRDSDLDALYQRLSAETPSRKITYKAIKPQVFFVVSGQEGLTLFYTRFDKNASAEPPVRGFTFAYPATRAAELNRVALAIANSFEAFPSRDESAMATAPSTSLPAPAAVPPAPTPPAATALIVAAGRALTAMKADDCPNPSVKGRPVRFDRTDPATGLAILAGDFAGNGDAPRLGVLAPDLVILSAANERVEVDPATLASDARTPSVIAAVDRSASGGPVFDRAGGLAALIAPIASEPKRVAGVPLAELHAVVGPEALGAFFNPDSVSRPADAHGLTAGRIAEREKAAVVAVFCN
jgi:hypothetical protein